MRKVLMVALGWMIPAVFANGQGVELPKGTMAFFQVKPGDVVASPLGESLRMVWAAAGAEVTEAYLKRLPVAPGDISYLGGVLFQPVKREEPRGVILVGFSKDVALVDLAKKAGWGKPPIRQDGVTLVGPAPVHLTQVDAKTIAIGPAVSLVPFLKMPREDRAEWKQVVALAAKEVASAWITTDLSVLPEEGEDAIRQGGGVFLDTFKGANAAGISFRFQGENAESKATMIYRDEKQAEASIPKWKLQREVLRGFLKAGEGVTSVLPVVLAFADNPGLKEWGINLGNMDQGGIPPVFASALFAYYAGAFSIYDEWLSKVEFNREGNAVTVSGKYPADQMQMSGAEVAVLVGLLLPAIQKTREAANRMQSSNNLKQIGIALHNYHSVHGKFPPAFVVDKNGKPLYSWRVLILPYIEQDNLFQRWKMDEAWDSPNNKPLSGLVIKVFNDPTRPASNKTPYRAFYGNGAMFEPGKKGTGPMGPKPLNGTPISDVTDGTSNTFMVVEAAEEVPWAAPMELAFDPKKPLPRLGMEGRPYFQALFGDGSVRVINRQIKEETLKKYITRMGGEVVQEDLP